MHRLKGALNYKSRSNILKLFQNLISDLPRGALNSKFWVALFFEGSSDNLDLHTAGVDVQRKQIFANLLIHQQMFSYEASKNIRVSIPVEALNNVLLLWCFF